jgi:hypothetical protein
VLIFREAQFTPPLGHHDPFNRVQAAAAPELVIHSGTCGHVGLFLEVELAVAKFLLVVDERSQRECLLLMVFVWGFSSKKHGFMIGVGL